MICLHSAEPDAGPHVDVAWPKGRSVKQLAAVLEATLRERAAGLAELPPVRPSTSAAPDRGAPP